ncbi:MAG TPA: DUF6515 family protein [Mucilaginibacter sp.]
MKKTYSNLIGISLISLLCAGLSIPANAQRGIQHSNDKSSGGGSTPPPSQPVSRPAPQPQVQRSSPPQQQQVQRSNPQPQQQVQRSNPQPQMQRNSPQPQSQMQRSSNSQRTNATSAPGSDPRGIQHRQIGSFTPNNPGTRRYPTIGSTQRPNNTYTPRGHGNSYRNGYRSYPGLRFGHNYVSPRPRGFYYQNRDYYRTYYTPQLGFSINILPRDYYPFYYGPYQYYYSEGLYYRQMEDNNYTVVEPPIGADIEKLPSKAQSIVINGMQYYELNGVYYQPVTRDDGTLVYQIAGKDGQLNVDDAGGSQEDLPQVGDLVDSLPEGCRILKLNGQRYYVSEEGYYFQDAIDTNGDKVFKIIATPDEEPEN